MTGRYGYTFLIHTGPEGQHRFGIQEVDVEAPSYLAARCRVIEDLQLEGVIDCLTELEFAGMYELAR